VFVIPGFTPDDKDPGVVARNTWGAGRQNVGSAPLYCVLFGNKGAAGTAELNTRYPVTTKEEADAYCEPRSELARMAHAALDVSGANIMIVAVEEVSGGTAATFTLDIGGTWSVGGELGIKFDEEVIRVAVAASHTPTTFGDALEDKVNQAQDGRLFCTASNTAGRVVFTVFSLGVRGNQHTVFLDKSFLPSGMTVTADQLSDVVKSGAGPVLAVTGSDIVDGTYVITISTAGAIGTAMATLTINGGSPSAPFPIPAAATPTALAGTSAILLTSLAGTYVLNETYTFTGRAALPNGGIPFMGGAGTDDIDDALDGTETVQNDYIAAAHNDATNVGKIEAACNAKAAWDVDLCENYLVVLNTGSQAAAIAIGQTTMNDQLGGCGWDPYGVEHPSRMAARTMALFSSLEGAQPNTNYDNYPVPGAAPHHREADSPNRSTRKSALNNSLMPFVTINGVKCIRRAINSRSLVGATPNYNTLDRADTIVAIRVRKDLTALGSEMKAARPYSGPDVEEGLPEGDVFTPRVWESKVNAYLLEHASPRYNWLQDVEANPCVAIWDPVGKRVMSEIPTIKKDQFHQLGMNINQTAS
jgi:phage tail sheath gpL-like